jgi:hypothetical protein
MNFMVTLSKSDFQLASTCPKKLVYKKQRYPTANDSNEFMEMLAQGGYVVGKMATLLFPSGIEILGNTNEAIERTKKLLDTGDCILFEAAIQSGQKLVRIDILEKMGNNLHLIEVKAKSHDSDDDPAESKKNLKKYIEDAAYQFLILSEVYPEYIIKCSLLMPDKAKRTSIDGLAGWFTIQKDPVSQAEELEELPAQQRPRFLKPNVLFKYEDDPDKDTYLQKLSTDGILEYLDVTSEVIKMQPDIKSRADGFLRILNYGITQKDYSVSKNCKSCEFNTGEIQPNGYEECWEDLASVNPHIFDLYYGGSIGHHTKGWYLDELITNRKVNLYDVDPERLKNSKGELGSRAVRQILQIQKTKSNEEWISPDLTAEISRYEYPLHFVDFETYTGALPFHQGMRPYELIAFQWSCHTIQERGAMPVHREWIHTGAGIPNFDFAKSLMGWIGDGGTPFMWAPHENTVLRTILAQMELFGHSDTVLENWLTRITTDKVAGREGRFVDMNNLTHKYYFHPHMKGRTSIKKVLPAVWNFNEYLYDVPHFKGYVVKDFEDGIMDPYDTLTAGLQVTDEDEVVKGGTAAMRAYHRIRYDDSLNVEQKNELRQQLLQYCKLDTMAMVIIAFHWGLK